MKLTTRIYLDAALQNIKSVAFFTFLPILIARLGASNLEIALSNSLPPLFCALSLAFLTRQLPVTRGVFLTSGYIRQLAFLSMALSVLLPDPIPYLLFFWSINAVSVMITGAQQPAILRRWVQPEAFPSIFSHTKMIGIVIVTLGSAGIGYYLDAYQYLFPLNYVISMLVGCAATFAGMSLIAELAPRERVPIRLQRVVPLQECDRRILWMGLNQAGIAVAAPLFVIYHIKNLNLSNSEIAAFVVTAGIVSAAVLPLARRAMERYGTLRIYGAAVLGMAAAVLPYGWIHSFWLLLLVQTWLGVCLAVHDVASQTLMMSEASKHRREMAYFSDFQLIMNAGSGIGALIAGVLAALLPIWGCFAVLTALRLMAFFSLGAGRLPAADAAPAAPPQLTGPKNASSGL